MRLKLGQKVKLTGPIADLYSGLMNIGDGIGIIDYIKDSPPFAIKYRVTFKTGTYSLFRAIDFKPVVKNMPSIEDV